MKILLAAVARFIGGNTLLVCSWLLSLTLGSEQSGRLLHFYTIGLGTSLLIRCGIDMWLPGQYRQGNDVFSFSLLMISINTMLIVVLFMLAELTIGSNFNDGYYIILIAYGYSLSLVAAVKLKIDGRYVHGTLVETASVYLPLVIFLLLALVLNSGPDNISVQVLSMLSLTGSMFGVFLASKSGDLSCISSIKRVSLSSLKLTIPMLLTVSSYLINWMPVLLVTENKAYAFYSLYKVAMVVVIVSSVVSTVFVKSIVVEKSDISSVIRNYYIKSVPLTIVSAITLGLLASQIIQFLNLSVDYIIYMQALIFSSFLYSLSVSYFHMKAFSGDYKDGLIVNVSSIAVALLVISFVGILSPFEKAVCYVAVMQISHLTATILITKIKKKDA